MKFSFTLCLAIFIVSNLSQAQKILVLPQKTSNNWCAYENLDIKHRMAYQGVNTAIAEKNYTPISYLMLADALTDANLCTKTANEVASHLTKDFNTQLYLLVNTEIIRYSGSINQVALSVKLYNAENKMLAASEANSNKMPTDKYDQLAEMAFNRCYDKIAKYFQVKPSVPLSFNRIENYSSNYEGKLKNLLPRAKEINNNAIAVVIGNKNYTNNDIPTAEYAINDALLVKAYLHKTMGIPERNIIYQQDASLTSLNKIFGNANNHQGILFNRLKAIEEATVYVYFSGHGIPDTNTKESYLVSSDTDPNAVSLTAYPMSQFYDNISKLPYSKLNIIIESCFSGIAANGALIRNASPVYINPTLKLKADENVSILTASESNEIASWYPEKQHSLFTYFLFKGLCGYANADKNKKISLAEIEQFTTKEVSIKASELFNRNQSPTINGDADLVLVDFK